MNEVEPAAAGGPPETRAGRVAAQLRDLIAQDVFPPGSRIRERDVAGRLTVSRTPLREALRILAAEGLVVLSPNRGAVVAKPTPREVEDLLALLGSLEALAGEQAAVRASDTELAEIRARHYEMLAAYAREDRLAYFKCNQAIHHAIVRASGNSALVAMHAQVNARVYRVRFHSNMRRTNWHHAVEQHEHILDALESRDGRLLSETLRAHLGNTWKNTRQNLDGLPEDAPSSSEPEHSTP